MVTDKKPAKPRKITKKPAVSLEILSNVEAIETTILALRTAGRLELVDTARVEIARRLAKAVDAAPDVASLWREYRAAENALRDIGAKNDGDPFTQLFEQFDAAVRNPSNPGA